MEQLGIFLTLIKTNWLVSVLIILSIIILTDSLFKGLAIGMKIIFSLLVIGVIGVMAFTLITFLS